MRDSTFRSDGKQFLPGFARLDRVRHLLEPFQALDSLQPGLEQLDRISQLR
jgi:hypothetical protein